MVFPVVGNETSQPVGDLRNQSVVVGSSIRVELKKLPMSVRAAKEWARNARGKASCQDKPLPAFHAMV